MIIGYARKHVLEPESAMNVQLADLRAYGAVKIFHEQLGESDIATVLNEARAMLREGDVLVDPPRIGWRRRLASLPG